MFTLVLMLELGDVERDMEGLEEMSLLPKDVILLEE